MNNGQRRRFWRRNGPQTKGASQHQQTRRRLGRNLFLQLLFFISLLHLISTTTAFQSTPTVLSTRIRHQPKSDSFLQNTAFSTTTTISKEQQQRATSISVARDQLQHYFQFPLDDWQLEAGGEIVQGHNVVVCAPTGAGKTVVGEMALHIAVDHYQDMNAIYTTPLKALSNQKFTELRAIFGKERVGLSTGDMSINRGAQLTVMTTEVYRNIAWRSTSSRHNNTDTDAASSSTLLEDELLNRNELGNNKVVVLDEFHYMGQPGRGGVWEESVITSPSHTQIVALSATLPNAKQLASWMEGVTGRKTVLVEATEGRPVPLRYLFATREGLYPLFRNPDAGPGSPLGLLGLRGDGIAPSANKRKQTRGFGGGNIGSDEDDDHDEDSQQQQRVLIKLPRGLQINPSLKSAAERRIQRINRIIDRQKARATFRRDEEDDWDPFQRSRSGGRFKSQMSARDERRERERLLRSEMRKAVPSLPILLRRLEQKDLLPAIFFIFSRAGCDEAAENVCNFMRGPRDVFSDYGDFEKEEEGSDTRQRRRDEDDRPQRKRKTRQRASRHREREGLIEDDDGRSFRRSSNYVSEDVLASVFGDEFTKRDLRAFETTSPLSDDNWDFYATAGLLSLSEVEQVANRIAAFNEDNEEIAFDDAQVERFLYGVGSHHAGMLAAHKAFVESLFRAQLMKVVFATETLAAGINMPARSTVVCSLAKRGDGSSMKLLETSNLLQMSGRAGRRGMDTDGTCVIAATPFEGPEVAASILVDEIKPIESQFSPSYALAVNLIARGDGKLDVARQLVQKSFAMWEKRQLEDTIAATVDEHGKEVSEVIEVASQERFMASLIDIFQGLVNKRSAMFDIARIQSFLDLLKDREALKKTSKSYIALCKMMELEQTTLEYLEREKETMTSVVIDDDDQLMAELLSEDQSAINDQIATQRKRFIKTERELSKHPFTTIANAANDIMSETTPEARALKSTLHGIRISDEQFMDPDAPLTGEELSTFSKSAIVMKRKTRKLQNAKPDLDSMSILKQVDRAETLQDDTWQDMLAITKVLVSYGCLSTEASLEDEQTILEKETYHVTPAGVNIGMIGHENSLWGLVAMGGAWDVAGVSSKLDDFRAAMDSFDDESDSNYDFYGTDDRQTRDSKIPKAQEEAETLVDQLRSLTPAELAGYASCLVSEGVRGTPSVIESFQRLTTRQQRVVQSSLLVLERLMEVQKDFSVDESSRRCTLELSNCEVVTAWAGGCSWSEALEISGAAPGDLVRSLGRALDALRQFANLPFIPIRAADFDGETTKTVSPGIHPQVRRLCRDAARAINRYPVKDPLPFDTEDEEVEDELEDEELEEVNLEETESADESIEQ